MNKMSIAAHLLPSAVTPRSFPPPPQTIPYSASSTRQQAELSTKKQIELNQTIHEQKTKIDDFLSSVNSRIDEAIHSQVSRAINTQQQVVESKERQLSHKDSIGHFRHKQLMQDYEEMKERLRESQEDMSRIIDILKVIKKEAERYKMEFDITTKELEGCRAKEKQLIKKVWMLEEDIKDIYSYETLENVQPVMNQSQLTNRAKAMTSRNRTSSSDVVKSHQNTSKTILTHETPNHFNNGQLKILLQESCSGQRHNIYEVTRLKQHLNAVKSSRYRPNPSYEGSSSFRDASSQGSSKNIHDSSRRKANMYDDLRHSLRKVTRMETDCPKYLEECDRQIGVEQFRLILINGPRILKQIQKIAIKDNCFLKEVDAQSIAVLNSLFSNPNSIKILEIILFSYSIQALKQIKLHKQAIVLENTTSEPLADPHEQEKPSARLNKRNQHKIDLQIHKKFKTKFSGRKMDVSSAKHPFFY